MEKTNAALCCDEYPAISTSTDGGLCCAGAWADTCTKFHEKAPEHDSSVSGAGRCALEEAVENLKGVACICASLAVSLETVSSKYAGSDMLLLCGVIESAIAELEDVVRQDASGRLPCANVCHLRGF